MFLSWRKRLAVSHRLKRKLSPSISGKWIVNAGKQYFSSPTRVTGYYRLKVFAFGYWNIWLVIWISDMTSFFSIQSPLTPRHPRLRHPRLYGIVLESPNFNPFISLLKFPATKAPCNKANPPLRHSNDGPLGGFNPPLRHLLCFFVKSVYKSNFTFLKFFEKILQKQFW